MTKAGYVALLWFAFAMIVPWFLLGVSFTVYMFGMMNGTAIMAFVAMDIVTRHQRERK